MGIAFQTPTTSVRFNEKNRPFIDKSTMQMSTSWWLQFVVWLSFVSQFVLFPSKRKLHRVSRDFSILIKIKCFPILCWFFVEFFFMANVECDSAVFYGGAHREFLSFVDKMNKVDMENLTMRRREEKTKIS